MQNSFPPHIEAAPRPRFAEPYWQSMPSILQREPLLFALPKAWRAALSHARIEPVKGGMSDASVFRVGSSRYLKIAQGVGTHDLRQEIERTAWLGQRGVSSRGRSECTTLAISLRS